MGVASRYPSARMTSYQLTKAASLSECRDIMDRIYNENPDHWPNGLTPGHFDGGLWMVRSASTNAPVGFTGWQERTDGDGRKVGYYSIGILPEHRHNGLAKAAVEKLIRMKSAGVDEVRALIKADNKPSLGLAEVLGVPVVKLAGVIPLEKQAILSTIARKPSVMRNIMGWAGKGLGEGLNLGAMGTGGYLGYQHGRSQGLGHVGAGMEGLGTALLFSPKTFGNAWRQRGRQWAGGYTPDAFTGFARNFLPTAGIKATLAGLPYVPKLMQQASSIEESGATIGKRLEEAAANIEKATGQLTGAEHYARWTSDVDGKTRFYTKADYDRLGPDWQEKMEIIPDAEKGFAGVLSGLQGSSSGLDKLLNTFNRPADSAYGIAVFDENGEKVRKLLDQATYEEMSRNMMSGKYPGLVSVEKAPPVMQSFIERLSNIGTMGEGAAGEGFKTMSGLTDFVESIKKFVDRKEGEPSEVEKLTAGLNQATDKLTATGDQTNAIFKGIQDQLGQIGQAKGWALPLIGAGSGALLGAGLGKYIEPEGARTRQERDRARRNRLAMMLAGLGLGGLTPMVFNPDIRSGVMAGLKKLNPAA